MARSMLKEILREIFVRKLTQYEKQASQRYSPDKAREMRAGRRPKSSGTSFIADLT